MFTSEEEGFVSEDEEVLHGLRFLSKHFKKGNIRTFDRGLDYNQYYKYLLSHRENFVIRAKKNRNVLYHGEKINILKLAHKFKGKYSLKFTQKNGTITDCKISVIPIKLPCRPQDDFNLVVCYSLFALLAKYKQGINHMLFNPPKHPQLQLSLFGTQPLA